MFIPEQLVLVRRSVPESNEQDMTNDNMHDIRDDKLRIHLLGQPLLTPERLTKLETKGERTLTEVKNRNSRKPACSDDNRTTTSYVNQIVRSTNQQAITWQLHPGKVSVRWSKDCLRRYQVNITRNKDTAIGGSESKLVASRGIFFRKICGRGQSPLAGINLLSSVACEFPLLRIKRQTAHVLYRFS